MKKITAIELAILLIAGLIPLLWLSPTPNFVISNGDSFPIYLNPQKTLNSATFLWNENNMGTADLWPACLIYQYMGAFFGNLGLGAGSVEILFQILFLMGAGVSMFYFARVIYPEHELAPLIAGMFYMFNFFVLQSRLNVGLAWTYAFLPLLMALFIRTIDTAYQQTGKKSNIMVILFSIATMVAFSFASINPTNIVLMLLALLVVAIYELIKYRKNLKPFLFTFSKILLISIPLNLWWLLPLLNVYVLSPQVLNSQVNVWDWSWTQSRSSFLNLFWFNGIWGWLPEYVPYLNAYTNPLLLVLVFVPFIVGASALLFKSNKSRFNAFIMLFVLLFIFLAKGLHDPLGQVNAALYDHIPLMNMFREPTSKFTMLIVAFMSLLIGYAGAHLANLKFGGHRHKRLLKFGVPFVLIAVFVVASFPIVSNPLESKTEQSPYSSYIQIPSYWTDAASWINDQNGDYKILFSPLDDFYQMPYNWGYNGMDQLFYRLIEKPVISTDYMYGYVLKPDTLSVLQTLSYSVNNGNVSMFKNLLDVLNIRYILQRNDVNTTGRDMLTPTQMHDFLSGQPYLRLAKSFGALDIYEYSEAKPSMYVFPKSVLDQGDIKIEMQNATEELWTFSSATDVQAWKNSTAHNQDSAGITQMTQDNGSLKLMFLNLSSNCENNSFPLFPVYYWVMMSDWKNTSSPIFPVSYGTAYTIKADLSAQDNYMTFLRIVEYNETSASPDHIVSSKIYNGYSNVSNAEIDYTPSNLDIHNIQIQICFSGTPFLSLQSAWIDNVSVTSQTPILSNSNIDNLFANTGNTSVTILKYQKINPTKVVLTVNATHPFVLATSQALDSSWTASFNGQQTKPISLYLGLNGFYIDATGQFEITVEYNMQLWFYDLLIVSTLTFVFCVIYLVYSILSQHYALKTNPLKRSSSEGLTNEY